MRILYPDWMPTRYRTPDNFSNPTVSGWLTKQLHATLDFFRSTASKSMLAAAFFNFHTLENFKFTFFLLNEKSNFFFSWSSTKHAKRRGIEKCEAFYKPTGEGKRKKKFQPFFKHIFKKFLYVKRLVFLFFSFTLSINTFCSLNCNIAQRNLQQQEQEKKIT